MGAEDAFAAEELSTAVTADADGGSVWHSKSAGYLSWAYEHCMDSVTASERESEECQTAISCYDLLSAASSACDVIWLPTMQVSELSRYVCGQSVCGSHAVEVEEKCGHFHRARSVFEPVMYYRDKYCPPGKDRTDMINDLYLCRERMQNSTSPLCEQVVTCQEQISAVDRNCPIPGGDMEEMEDVVCSDECRNYIASASDSCQHYAYLVNSLQAYVAYQESFSCTGVASIGVGLFRRKSLASLLNTAPTGVAFIMGSVLIGLSTAFLGLRAVSYYWQTPPYFGVFHGRRTDAFDKQKSAGGSGSFKGAVVTTLCGLKFNAAKNDVPSSEVPAEKGYRPANLRPATFEKTADVYMYDVLFSHFQSDKEFWGIWSIVDCAAAVPDKSQKQACWHCGRAFDNLAQNACKHCGQQRDMGRAPIRVVMDLPAMSELPRSYPPVAPGKNKPRNIPGLPAGYTAAGLRRVR
ncbi:unnamed protein product [Effrenium voratum]|nr:unnamed protein product [Effrenium voratum]